ncbi:MAG TPA: DUF885 domain-containing protein [Candidatus Acidoferrum sp.]|nr:DUF885 domain-containing protein [Candidatus Acidoferrum sp.]
MTAKMKLQNSAPQKIIWIPALMLLVATALASGWPGSGSVSQQQAASAQASLAERRKQLNDLLAENWDYTMRISPIWASMLGDKRFNDKLPDFSEKAIYGDLEEQKKFLARFQAIDTNGFPEQEVLNKTLMVRNIELQLEDAKFKEWEMPVTQFSGLHIDLPQWFSVLPFDSAKDYEDYITRLKSMPQAFDDTMGLMRKGLADHLMPPKILLDQVVRQSETIAKSKPEESPFMEPAKKFPASFTAEDKNRLQERMLTVVREQVTPAYEKFTKFVREEYAPHGRSEPGLWALPDGDARYAYAAKTVTTTNLTPEQIHQLGLQEVAKDHAAMLKTAQKLGFTDRKALEATVTTNPVLHPKSRQELLDLYSKYENQMWAKLPELFGRLPKAKVEVLPVESYHEKEASDAYYVFGTPDGKRPGHIMVNTGDLEKRTLLEVESTAYHEGVPGHHLQGSIAQELPTLPPFRQHAYYIAYGEGWGLYSERLGEEVGFYQDPYSMYGHLQADLLRAIRLVVDTGLHSKHWTRQQVVDYFHANSGIDEPEVQSETDRYIAWPAQALGYKIGQLKIIELRERAKKELGSKFDIRSFHDTVLSGGALPLDLLEKRINEWVEAQRGAARSAAAN